MFDIRKTQEEALYRAIEEECNASTAKEIIYGKSGSVILERNSDWVKAAMWRLESRFDAAAVKKIRMKCQCGYGMEEKLALLKELMKTASSIETLCASEKARAAGLFCKDGHLYLQFTFCPCPMLADVELLERNAWCQCTTGYSKVLFEKAFHCKVEVELLQSIKMGHDTCLMNIILHEPIWSQ